MLCTRAALADDNLEAVAVSEGVPYRYRISQELPGIPSNESEFTTECAVSSYGRELLQDSSFKLIKSVKLLEVDNDLVFFS